MIETQGIYFQRFYLIQEVSRVSSFQVVEVIIIVGDTFLCETIMYLHLALLCLRKLSQDQPLTVGVLFRYNKVFL